MPHLFLFLAWMFLLVLFGYYSVHSNKIGNPSGCCSFPHGHAFSSIFSCVWSFPCRGSSWHPALHPSPWGFHPGLSTLFLWASLFFSLIGSLGIFDSGIYSFIKSSFSLFSFSGIHLGNYSSWTSSLIIFLNGFFLPIWLSFFLPVKSLWLLCSNSWISSMATLF